MTVIKTAFGYINEYNKPCDEFGNVLPRPVVDTTSDLEAKTADLKSKNPKLFTTEHPLVAHLVMVGVDDPLHQEYARVRKVSVHLDRVVLCHAAWDRLLELDGREAAALCRDARELRKMDVPWYSSQFMPDFDGVRIALAFPGRRVYVDGKEVFV